MTVSLVSVETLHVRNGSLSEALKAVGFKFDSFDYKDFPRSSEVYFSLRSTCILALMGQLSIQAKQLATYPSTITL
jgi:hypothetical protein